MVSQWGPGLSILYCNYAINGFSSLMTLCLMHYMWSRNRMQFNLYTKCVLLMTSYQMLYELTDPMLFEVSNPGGYQNGGSPTLHFFVILGIYIGGIGCSLWSFMILACALFTVHFGRQPSKKEELIAGVTLNVAIWAYSIPATEIEYLVYKEELTAEKLWLLSLLWDFIRIGFIVLSMVVVLWLYYILRKTSIKGQRERSPLYHLLRKLIPYPIICLISRSGASVYKQVYLDAIESYPGYAIAGFWKTFWFYIAVVFMPAIGLLSLIAFTKVTPGARRSLIQMLHLDGVFTLPVAPAKWAEQDEKEKEKEKEKTGNPMTNAEAIDNETEERQSRFSRHSFTLDELELHHELLYQMDEYELANAVALTINKANPVHESREEGGGRGENGDGNGDGNGGWRSSFGLGIAMPKLPRNNDAQS